MYFNPQTRFRLWVLEWTFVTSFPLTKWSLAYRLGKPRLPSDLFWLFFPARSKRLGTILFLPGCRRGWLGYITVRSRVEEATKTLSYLLSRSPASEPPYILFPLFAVLFRLSTSSFAPALERSVFIHPSELAQNLLLGGSPKLDQVPSSTLSWHPGLFFHSIYDRCN